ALPVTRGRQQRRGLRRLPGGAHRGRRLSRPDRTDRVARGGDRRRADGALASVLVRPELRSIPAPAAPAAQPPSEPPVLMGLFPDAAASRLAPARGVGKPYRHFEEGSVQRLQRAAVEELMNARPETTLEAALEVFEVFASGSLTDEVYILDDVAGKRIAIAPTTLKDKYRRGGSQGTIHMSPHHGTGAAA